MRRDDAGLPGLDALVQRVREEVARRRGVAAPARAARTPSAAPVVGPIVSLSPPPLPNTQAYRLDDLLAFHDREFVRQAYLAVLKRPPDAPGEAHYLSKLRGGALTQVDILGRLRYSPEGKRHKVKIAGLLSPLALRQLGRVPVLGYVVALGTVLLRLPVLVRNLQTFEAHSFHVQSQLADAVNGVSRNAAAQQQDTGALQHDVDTLHARLDGMQHGADAVREVLATLHAQMQATHAGLAQRLDGFDSLHAVVDALRTRLDAAASRADIATLHADLEMALRHAREAADAHGDRIAALQSQLAFVETQSAEHLRRVAAVQADSDAIKEVLERQHYRADALQARSDAADAALAPLQQTPATLAALERRVQDHRTLILDTQRRTTLMLEEARKRLPEPMSQAQVERIVAEDEHMLDAFYVSFEDQFRGTRDDIKQRASYYLPIVAEAGAGSQAAPVLDLGCGRGEWLEVLQDNGLVARGIDLNRIMVQHCIDHGLQATEVDAIAYLRGIGANTLGAVSAMHLIEHLPFRTLVTLFDEALRVLRPGGVVIFETPNPENVTVGACNFYMDPTHRNPLPPPLVQFIAEARGFVGVEIHRLSQNRGAVLPPPVLGADVTGAAEVNLALGELHHLLASAPDYALVARKA